jgi:hypothetical protein
LAALAGTSWRSSRPLPPARPHSFSLLSSFSPVLSMNFFPAVPGLPQRSARGSPLCPRRARPVPA